MHCQRPHCGQVNGQNRQLGLRIHGERPTLRHNLLPDFIPGRMLLRHRIDANLGRQRAHSFTQVRGETVHHRQDDDERRNADTDPTSDTQVMKETK